MKKKPPLKFTLRIDMPEWERRARQAAAELRVPEAEAVRETRAALVRVAAETIAVDEATKWTARSGVKGEVVIYSPARKVFLPDNQRDDASPTK